MSETKQCAHVLSVILLALVLAGCAPKRPAKAWVGPVDKSPELCAPDRDFQKCIDYGKGKV